MKLFSREYCTALGNALRTAAHTFASRRPKKYYLTVCLCFKQCAADLAEWIEFHHLVGVEHFYLYNNDSCDGFAEVLRPYVASGLVTLRDWPGGMQQVPIYEHCIKTYRTRARWIVFIDDDEFLFPATGNDLREKLKIYESYGGVGVCRFVFGGSGHEARPDGLVIENYVRRKTLPGAKIKSIVNPMDVTTCSPHGFGYRRGIHAVDEMLRMLPEADAPQPSVEHLCINHYFTKSYEDYLRKVERGKADKAQKRGLPDKEAWAQKEVGRCAVEDRQIQRFLPQLQKRLQRQRKEAARTA